MTTVDIVAHLTGIVLLLVLTPLFVWQLVLDAHDRMADVESAAADRVDLWHDDVRYWDRAMQSTNPARARLGAEMSAFLWAHNPHREG